MLKCVSEFGMQEMLGGGHDEVRLAGGEADPHGADVDNPGDVLFQAQFRGKDEVSADACCQLRGERWCATPGSETLELPSDEIEQGLLAAIEHGADLVQAEGAGCCPHGPGLVVNLLSEVLRGRLGEVSGLIVRRMPPPRHLDECAEGVHPVRWHTCDLQFHHQALRSVRASGLSDSMGLGVRVADNAEAHAGNG